MTKATTAGHTGPAQRLAAFAQEWPKGVLRGDTIYEFADRSGFHQLLASELAEVSRMANCFPDLLEALQIALDEREQEHGRLPDGAPHWSVRARAAIAKALPTSGGSNG